MLSDRIVENLPHRDRGEAYLDQRSQTRTVANLKCPGYRVILGPNARAT